MRRGTIRKKVLILPKPREFKRYIPWWKTIALDDISNTITFAYHDASNRKSVYKIYLKNRYLYIYVSIPEAHKSQPLSCLISLINKGDFTYAYNT